MFNFLYYTPTKVVFGKGTEKEAGRQVREHGGSKVLLHYGGGSVVRSGLLGRIRESLEAEGLAYVELGGVVPNPRLSLVYEGIRLAKQEQVDFILAVGGGSVIDSAKAIGYGVANEGDVWDFYDHTRQASACLPIGAVVTIAAAGSEMSNSSVITKEEGGIKRGYNSELCRPRFAIMNPELTATLPDYQTACGCTDILMHTMERYFTNGGNMEITDSIALLHKESDRAEAIRREYEKVGIEVDLSVENVMKIRGGEIRPATVFSHNDHRMAMSMAVSALRCDGDVKIENAECVEKSYPAFFDDLESITVK